MQQVSHEEVIRLTDILGVYKDAYIEVRKESRRQAIRIDKMEKRISELEKMGEVKSQ